jgi:hypothetical protein
VGVASNRKKRGASVSLGSTRQMAIPDRKGVHSWVWQYQTEKGCIRGCGSNRQKRVHPWVWHVPDGGVHPCVWYYHTEVCIHECGSNRQGRPVV